MTCCLCRTLLTTAFIMAFYWIGEGLATGLDLSECQTNLLSRIREKDRGYSGDIVLTLYHSALVKDFDLVNGLQYSVNVTTTLDTAISMVYLVVSSCNQNASTPLSSSSSSSSPPCLIDNDGDSGYSGMGSSSTGIAPGHHSLLPRDSNVIGCHRFMTSSSTLTDVTWTPPDSNESLGCLSITPILQLRHNDRLQYGEAVTLCPPPVSDCRHYRLEDYGWITSPGYPERYPDNADCLYTIIGYPGASIDVQIIHLEPAYSGECVDYVTLSSSDVTSQRYCGRFGDGESLRGHRYVSLDEFVRIKFHSDSKISDQGFEAFFAVRDPQGCHSTFTDISGSMSSPRHPSQYLPNTLCTYRVRLPTSYRVIFQILHLDLGHESTQTIDNQQHQQHQQHPKRTKASCTKDFLSITDLKSNSSVILKCTHGDAPISVGETVFESSSSFVDVLFSSDHFQEGRGFKLAYKGVPSCKNESLSSSTGTIFSPSYPNSYPNNQKCFYKIRTPSGQSGTSIDSLSRTVSLELRFISLYTESDVGDLPLRDGLCLKDYVYITSGNAAYRVCGNWSGKEHIITFPNLPSSVTVKFVSDDQRTKSGFSLEWKTTPFNESLQDCLSQVVSTNSQHFQVIYEPLNWADAETDCRSRGGHLARVEDLATQEILANRIDDSKNKCLNKHSFWIGANDRQWESDFYWISGGKAQFTNWFPGWAQSQASQRQPSDDGLSNEDCVELRRQFHLPWKGTRDAGGYFWNDRDCSEKNPYICGRVTNVPALQSSQCNRHIHLVREPDIRGTDITNTTNNNNNYSSNNINNTSDAFSRDVRVTFASGAVTLTSPGYPDNYGDFLNCSITITSPSGTGIMLEMDSFWLEGPNDLGECVYDSLSVDPFPDTADGRLSERKEFCGDWTGTEKKLHQVIGQNFVTLTFTTDHSRTFQGFKAKVWILEANHFCGEEGWLFNSGTCVQASPIPKPLEDAMGDCQSKMATIGVPKWSNYSDWLYILDVIETTTVTFWDNEQSDPSKNNCTTVTVSSTSSQVKDDAQINFSRDSDLMCDGLQNYMCQKIPLPYGSAPSRMEVFSSSPGNLSLVDLFNETSNYNYENLASVWIHIQSPENTQILIALTKVSIEEQTKCLYDYVEIQNSSLNQRICGELPADDVIRTVSHTKETSIHFQSDYSQTGSGVDIMWSWIDLDRCHQDYFINASSNFQVASFNYPNPYPSSIDCSLTIRAPLEYRSLAIVFDVISPIDFIDGAEVILEEVPEGMEDSNSVVAYTVNSSMYSDTLSPVLVSNTGFLRLNYRKSTGMGDGEGYQASVKSVVASESASLNLPVEIQALLQGESSKLYSIGYPSQAPTSVVQTVVFRAPIGYKVQASLTEHNGFLQVDCSSQFIRLFDVSVTTPKAKAASSSRIFHHKAVGTWCGTETKFSVSSSLNRLKIRINYGTQASAGLRFVISVTVVKDTTYLKKTRKWHGRGFDLCRESPCLHGGVCQQNDTFATCDCSPRYGGTFCQELWCVLSPCLHGWCNMTSWGYVCTCLPDYYGVACDLDDWGCASHLCNGRGRCLPGNQTHPTCKCSEGWTGSMCANRVENGDESLSLGQRLLKEPIWIGLIVILSVLLMFGVSYVIRRKCGRYFSCCDLKKPRISDNILNADGTIALNSFPLRGIVRASCVSIPKSSVSTSPGTHTVFIKTDTDSDAEALTPAPTPSGQDNGEAAARFFASYKNADKNPIATPLTTDFTRTTDTSLSQEVDDASVGAMVGGRLLFDLHIRENKAKAREESAAMERTTSLLAPSRPSSLHSKTDRMKRSHSTGPYLVRQETQFDEFSVSGGRPRHVTENDPSGDGTPRHIFPHVIVEKCNSNSSLNQGFGNGRRNINDIEEELSLREIQVTIPNTKHNEGNSQNHKFTDSSGARVIEVSLDGESEDHGSTTVVQMTPKPDARSHLKGHKPVVSLGDEETLSREIEKLIAYRNFIKEWKNHGASSVTSSSMSVNDDYDSRVKGTVSLDSDLSKTSTRYLKKRHIASNHPLRRTRTVDDVGSIYHGDVRRKRERYSKQLNHSSQSLDGQEVISRYNRHIHNKNHQHHSSHHPHNHHRHSHQQQQHYSHQRDSYRARKYSSYHTSWDIPESPDVRSVDDVETYKRLDHVGYVEWKGTNSYEKDAGNRHYPGRAKMRPSSSEPSFLPSDKIEDHRRLSPRQSHSTSMSKHRKARRSRHSSSRSSRNSRRSRGVHDSSSENDITVLGNRLNNYSNIRQPKHKVHIVAGTLDESNSKIKSKLKTQHSFVRPKVDISKTSNSLPDISQVDEKDHVFSSVFSQEVEIDDFSPVEDNIDLDTLRPNSKSNDTLFSMSSWPHLSSPNPSSSKQYLSVNPIYDSSHSHTDSEIDYKNKHIEKLHENISQISTNKSMRDQDTVSKNEAGMSNRSQDRCNSPSSCKVIVYNSHTKMSETARPAIVNTRHLLTRKHSSLDLFEPPSHVASNNSGIRSAASLQDLSSTGVKEHQVVITLPPPYQSNSRRGSITNVPIRNESVKRVCKRPQTPTNSLSMGQDCVDNTTIVKGDLSGPDLSNTNYNSHHATLPGNAGLTHEDKRDVGFYLAVTDTDSAMSSAPSHNSSPTGQKGLMMENDESNIYSYETKVEDSAYETKQSSLEADAYLESKGLKNKAPVREDRRVTQRLHQAAVKLFIIQQRVRKARQHLSRDSAIHTISEDDPSLDDIVVTNSKSWTFKPGVLYPANSEEDENNPESHPLHCGRILEEQDCRVEYEV